MIAELGHIALGLAFCASMVGALASVLGVRTGDARLLALTPAMAISQFFLTLFSFLALTYLFVVSDFSVALVADNSHTLKPMLYKVAGVWGNHEGSLLLWVLILTLFASAVAVFGGALPTSFRSRVLGVQSLISLGFFGFLLFTSNPFLRLNPAPLEGSGLNPLLQDPGLAFHPPFLYLGYVGFSIAFSFAIAALLEGRVGALWARWVRPWTLMAWCALTAGIALGSWWAYYELGWGGWWFWDPVENASFMPWLAGTALLHTAIVVEKREALKSWAVLLAILTFSLSLLGTFLVRSGVLTSVHAFAVDPARGLYILAFLILVIGGGLLLYGLRADRLKSTARFRLVSREGGLVLNNILLVSGLGVVLLGTLYPLFIDALTGAKISVGAPYFNAAFVPLMMLLVVVLGFGPLLPWKRAKLAETIRRMALPLGLFAVAFLLVLWLAPGGVTAALGIALAIFLMAGVARELIMRAGTMRRLLSLPRAHWGMSVAHMGLALSILGMTASSFWTEEHIETLMPGETLTVGAYDFTFDGVAPRAGPNYTVVRGMFTVTRDGATVVTLYPEDRTYWTPPMQTTEAAIDTTLMRDLFAVVGDPAPGGGWTVRLYVRPAMAWIWLGALVMMLGGLLSLSDRRVRVGLVRTREAKHVT